MNRAVYLDCNATTPVDPRVAELVHHHLTEEFGNAGSRTHEFGNHAKQAVQKARDQVAAVASAQRDEVLFTSGATESNNIAILGLARFGEERGRRHLVSTAIEHKAVLEPLEELAKRGFEVDLVRPNRGGWVEPAVVASAVRPDTLLVSVMHVNNETGIEQPVREVASALRGHPAYLHVDAAQGFGKSIPALRDPRIDLISISGHKLFAPKGIGALIARRRGFERVPLQPLQFGGGQERGLRPGTLPVALIAGLGLACDLALAEHEQRAQRCAEFKGKLLAGLAPLSPAIHGDQERCLPHVVNMSFEGLDSEAVMLAIKDLVAISNGSACTSHSYTPSHVLRSMELPESEVQGAIRLSWCHATDSVDWSAVAGRIAGLR